MFTAGKVLSTYPVIHRVAPISVIFLFIFLLNYTHECGATKGRGDVVYRQGDGGGEGHIL